jgi:hypothetical protein
VRFADGPRLCRFARFCEVCYTADSLSQSDLMVFSQRFVAGA